MCTVTFLPLQAQAGFILTSNRDEGIHRPEALPPQHYRLHGNSLIFPKDTQANGTWIVTGYPEANPQKQFTLCLLNGAFVKHRHQPPYRMSRGLVVLDFFRFSTHSDPLYAFMHQYELAGIEPFTLLLIFSDSVHHLHELRWDGERLHHLALDSQQPHIWSSVTLYPPEMAALRRQWFGQWLEIHPQYQANDILMFHGSAGNGDPASDVLMHRPGQVSTVSTTAIEKTAAQTRVHYINRIREKTGVVLNMQEEV